LFFLRKQESIKTKFVVLVGGSASLEAIQIISKLLAEFWSFQGQTDGGFQVTELISGIVALPLKKISVDRLIFEE
jgi:hypothetical protein